METLNGVIKFLSIDNPAGASSATGDLSNFIVILIAVIALCALVFTIFANKKNHLYGKHLSKGVVVSSTKVIQIFSVVLLAVSIMAIGFTGIKAFASEIFSIDDFEVTADIQNNTVNYSQSKLVNNSDNDMKIQSMALSKESSLDDNDTIWTIKYGDKILYSWQATGKDFTVDDLIVTAHQTVPLTLTAENLSAQKVNALSKSVSVISFTIKTVISGITVTFDKNAADAIAPTPAKISVTYDTTYGTLATTSRPGYTFAGWYTAASEGNKVEATTIVKNAEAHTLYAHWLKSLDVDGYHYFPVVTQFKDVTFYNDKKEKITPALDTGYEMSDLTKAYFYSGDTSLYQVFLTITGG